MIERVRGAKEGVCVFEDEGAVVGGVTGYFGHGLKDVGEMGIGNDVWRDFIVRRYAGLGDGGFTGHERVGVVDILEEVGLSAKFALESEALISG